MQTRKTNTYEVFPPSPDAPATEPPNRPAGVVQEPDQLDPSALPEPDRTLLSSCWELATQYKDRGRAGESVEYFLVAAALFERSGQVPRRIYELVLELDPDNALAASRLDSDGVSGSRAALFIQHVLSRHDPSQVRKVLQDERQRNWVTPPRGAQQTCPDCGMGIPNGQDRCTFCGASLGTGYRKRATAAYRIPGKTRTLPGGVPLTPPPGPARQPAEISGRADAAPEPAALPQAAQSGRQDTKPATTRQGLVRILDLEGGLLTEGLVGQEGCLVGSARGGLGQDLTGIPREVLHISFSNDTFTYEVTNSASVYQVIQGSMGLEGPRIVQAGNQLFRFTGRNGRVEVELLSQDGDTSTICRFAGPSITIGRTDNDLDLPNDTYLADHHFQVTMDHAGGLTITDLDTDSGTFIALDRQGTLPPDTVVRIQNLFLVLTLPS